MADSYSALVKTTTASTGTNDYVLATAALTTPHRTPKQAVADTSITDGDIVQYAVRDTTVTGDASFELGEGVYDDATNTITRLAANVFDGSNGGPGNLVSWPGSGVRDVTFQVSPSVKLPRLDRANAFIGGDVTIENGEFAVGTATAGSTYFGVIAGIESQSAPGSHASIAVRAGDSTASASLVLTAGATAKWLISGRNSFGSGSADRLAILNAAASEVLALAQSGNFGLGLDDPQTNCHIQESNTDTVPALEIEQLSTGDAALQFSIVGASFAMGIDNDDNNNFKISQAGAAGGAVLGTNDRISISPTGEVGINKSLPSAGRTLDIEDAGAVVYMKSTSGGQPQLKMDQDQASAGLIVGRITGLWDGNEIGFIEFETGDDTTNKDEGDITFTTFAGGALTEHLRIHQEGDIDFPGFATEALVLKDAGSAAATEQDWIEVVVGATTGYIRVFAAK